MGKFLFCGASKSGKTSFSRLLRNKDHISEYESTPVGETKQVFVRERINIKGMDWADLDSQEEIDELSKRLRLKVKEQLNPEFEKNGEADIAESLNLESDDNSSSSVASLSPSQKPSVQVETQIINSSAVASETTSAITDSEVWDVLTLLDTGGQPEFINLLPAINESTAITFVVLDLSRHLDKPVIAQHSDKNYNTYELSYSNLHLLQCLLSFAVDSSTMKSYCYPKAVMVQEDQQTRKIVCFVGTFADKIKDQLETVVTSVDEKIGEIVKEIDCSLWSDENGKYLHAVDNTVSRDVENSLAQRIRQKSIEVLQKKAQFEIPITWFILELELRTLHLTENRVCVSLQKVKEISDRIMPDHRKMDLPEIREVLKLYHHFGVLLYFDEVDGMKDYVIIDSQWLFSNLTKILKCKFDTDLYDAKDINAVYQKGLFTEDLLGKIALDIQDLTMDSFLNLLKHLKVIAPIAPNDKLTYFMPTVLPTCDSHIVDKSFFNEKEYGKPFVFKDLTVMPLLVEFAKGYIPRGLFGFLIVQILQGNSNFELYGTNEQNKVRRCSNLITFFKKPYCYVTICDKISYLELQVRIKQPVKTSLHFEVQNTFTDALKEVCCKFGWQFNNLRYGFMCCECSSTQPHLSQISETEPIPTSFPEYSSCKQQQCTPLRESHSVWFKAINSEVEDITKAATNVVSQLKKLDISDEEFTLPGLVHYLRNVADWSTLALFLLPNDYHSIPPVNVLIPNDYIRYRNSVITKYNQVAQDRSWKKVVKRLEWAGENEVVANIKKHFHIT